jgi:hypothetical protein
MFIGHYSVAFAAKTERNKIPLWVLFVAVQFLDYIWATLVLLGIEKLRVIKGFTAGSMLDSYFHPYSHSLITALLWSVAGALCYKSLPIYDNIAKVGFGLWNYRDPEFILEMTLLALGIGLYLKRNVIPAIQKRAIIAFGIALLIIQIGDTYVPREALSDKGTALGVWISYTVLVLIAFFVEKIRARAQTSVQRS